MRTALLIVAQVVFVSLSLHAQLTDSDTSGVRGKVTVSGNYTAGTVSRTLIIAGAEIGAANERLGLWSGVNYAYGTFSGRVTERDVLFRTFGYLSPLERVYPFAMLWVERSVRRAVDVRLQPALGGTFVALRSENASLRFSLSVAPEFVTWSMPLPTGETQQEVLRAIGRVAVRVQTDDRVLKLDAELWAQPNVQEFSDIRAYAQSTLSAQVWRSVRLQGTLTWLREEAVPASVKRNDLFITLGISYTFGTAS